MHMRTCNPPPHLTPSPAGWAAGQHTHRGPGQRVLCRRGGLRGANLCARGSGVSRYNYPRSVVRLAPRHIAPRAPQSRRGGLARSASLDSSLELVF